MRRRVYRNIRAIVGDSPITSAMQQLKHTNTTNNANGMMELGSVQADKYRLSRNELVHQHKYTPAHKAPHDHTA